MKIDPFTGAAVATDASAAPSPGAEAAPKAPPVLQLMAEPSGSIRGRVLEASAEVGVPGVEVALYSGERRVALQIAKSDQAGYYQLKSLAPGSYRLAVLRRGGRVFVAQPEAELAVSAGVQQAGPVRREVDSVSLLGQVLDVNGRPVPEAIVKVSIQGYPGEALAVGSDSEGRFEARGLQGADQVEVWAVRLGQESPRFGPVTIGSSGLQDIMLRLPSP
ncbi:MAG: carboxypeptidase regulatory-like domain-containing protein [Phycisphaerales bacterium]|nr:carboxypeptidase regulatory-like domain-containing protein [Phycisphaerales bacterium]